MFSDFKSCGFSIADSKLTDCKRMERLILVMALALIITTSVGIQNPDDTKKTPQKLLFPFHNRNSYLTQNHHTRTSNTSQFLEINIS
jgi:hypothetical protein